MFYCEVNKGQFIIEQGDLASSFFIIGKNYNKKKKKAILRIFIYRYCSEQSR